MSIAKKMLNMFINTDGVDVQIFNFRKIICKT